MGGAGRITLALGQRLAHQRLRLDPARQVGPGQADQQRCHGHDCGCGHAPAHAAAPQRLGCHKQLRLVLPFCQAAIQIGLHRLPRRLALRHADVQAGPCGGRLLFLAPRQRFVQAALLQQRAAFVSVVHRQVEQAFDALAGLGFGTQPAPQAVPKADQAFVRDVDGRIAGQLRTSHQKPGVAAAESLDHLFHLSDRSAHGRDQPLEAHRPAAFAAFRSADGVARIGDALGQCAKDFFDYRLQARQVAADLCAVHRQRVGGGAHRGVVGQVDGLGAAGRGDPVVPASRQHMLQHREFVVLVGHVVQQPLHQPRGDLAAAQCFHRRDDGFGTLGAGHARHQVLAAADGLGQPAVDGARAQRVGAHCDHHAHRRLAVLRRVEQQVDEGAGLVRVELEAEDLLELVDHHQQPLPRCQVGHAHRLDQPLAAQLQPPQHARLDVAFVGVGVQRGLQGSRQRGHRAVARPQHGAQPARLPGLVVQSTQAVDQPGAHQRRFAAARLTGDGQQRHLRQARRQLVDLTSAAEEAVGLAGLERAQARERVGGPQRVDAAHAGLSRPSSAGLADSTHSPIRSSRCSLNFL